MLCGGTLLPRCARFSRGAGGEPAAALRAFPRYARRPALCADGAPRVARISALGAGFPAACGSLRAASRFTPRFARGKPAAAPCGFALCPARVSALRAELCALRARKRTHRASRGEFLCRIRQAPFDTSATPRPSHLSALLLARGPSGSAVGPRRPSPARPSLPSIRHRRLVRHLRPRSRFRPQPSSPTATPPAYLSPIPFPLSLPPLLSRRRSSSNFTLTLTLACSPPFLRYAPGGLAKRNSAPYR
jgi:hypothetical protein